MNRSRIIWKIVVGAVLILVAVSNLPLYLNGSTQANVGRAMSILAILGGFYLVIAGFTRTAFKRQSQKVLW